MGATFTTIQIRNRNQLEPEQFMEALSKYMGTKGLIPATEDDAEFSYSFVYSKNKRWIAFSTPNCADYPAESLLEEVQALAKAMKANAIIMSVVDSDMVVLNCFGETGGKAEQAVLGRPDYGFEDAVMGSPKYWTPLLTENYTFEELLEVWQKEETFAEDILANMSPLLGMDPEHLRESYNGSDEIILHYKKAGASKKPQSLNTVFKQIFGEALEPLGFVKLKGKYPYFVRLVGNEILHVVTCKKGPGWNEYCILGGVATVYRNRIDLDRSPRSNTLWLKEIYCLCDLSNLFDWGNEYSKSITSVSYTEETTVDAVKHSLKMTEKIILPIFNNVVDIRSCIEYLDRYGIMNLHYKNETFGNDNIASNCNEGLLWYKLNDRDAYIEIRDRGLERQLAWIICKIKEGVTGHTQEHYEKQKRINDEGRPQRLARANEIFNDHEWRGKVLEELERRKATNIILLRSFGIKI
jgi:hypothetical protein